MMTVKTKFPLLFFLFAAIACSGPVVGPDEPGDDPVEEPGPGDEPGDEPTAPYDGVATLNIDLDGRTIPGRKGVRDGCKVELLGGDEVLLSAEGGIRLRGNGTRFLEKSPYDLKLGEKASVLGMPKDKRWVLLANYLDRTSLRNDVGLEIARRAGGMPWNPKGEFVNLYYNGRYSGLYFLCEKIKISKDRVSDGEYLLEFDNYNDETVYYTSTYRYPVKIKEPDDVAEADSKYILGYLNELEGVLSDKTKLSQHLYEDYIDVESFIDWWLTGETVMCKDYNGPASCYMYKAVNGKLFAGPIWDLDLYTFSSSVHNVNYFLLNGTLYYGALFKDEKFRAAVKDEWAKMKSSLEDGFSIYDYIDKRSALIKDEISKDDALYPNRSYSVLAGDEYVDFATAVNMMKNFLKARISALDKLIAEL